MTTSDRNFESLRKSFTDGRLIPFVGAGFSMVDPKLPGWLGFLGKLRARLSASDRAIFDKLGKLEKAEFVRCRNGKKGDGLIADITKKILRHHPKNPTALAAHKILVNHFDRIYTTNYDRYFETVARILTPKVKVHSIPPLGGMSPRPLEAYIQRNKTSNRVECPKKGEKPKACRIVKYHGDYRVAGSLVLTETSYFKRLLDVDAKDILFSADALHFDFLFLGYGFDDLSLKFTLQQLDRIFETLGNSSKRGAFYILRTDEGPKADFQNIAYNLSPIDFTEALDGKPICYARGKSCLRSFHPHKPRPRCRCRASHVFRDFSVLWKAAEEPVHSPTRTAAVSLRARVLMQGFTAFLEKLVA